MLLINYTRIIEIDKSITNLQSELVKLYDERSEIVSSTEAGAPTTFTTKSTNDLTWEVDTHQWLTETWSDLDIKIPEFKNLQTKLTNAKFILQNLKDTQPNDAFDVILIPPAHITRKLHTAELLSAHNIKVNTPIQLQMSNESHSWNLYVISIDPLGIATDDYKYFIVN
ncbi:MAG: hypothetical protein ACR2FM_02935 [Candidatus Saccharimonadales bacterium]